MSGRQERTGVVTRPRFGPRICLGKFEKSGGKIVPRQPWRSHSMFEHIRRVPVSPIGVDPVRGQEDSVVGFACQAKRLCEIV